eukprot:c6035_g1_i1.p1 GENE.c6035_g1_i1~~c6035_g1_i1.p1  ORF type:complete len:653 (+),score=210.75 c6035_g1_i1:40-1959(+)
MSSGQEGSGGVLPLAVARNLGDKVFEKRKAGALEVEIAVRDLHASEHHKVIRDIILCLRKDFLESSSPNHRKGGLLGIAAVAVGLNEDFSMFLDDLINPVLVCFVDPDSRTRYHACEAMYNIIKMARSQVVPRFNNIFEGLFKLSADPSEEVRKAMGLVDHLLKDVVAESSSFDMHQFVPELNARLEASDPNSRQFVIGWVQALNGLPGLDMVVFIPELLDGLFRRLGETKPEIREMACVCLHDMLEEIKQAKARADFVTMIHIVLHHCKSEDPFIHLTAIRWLSDFILLAHQLLLAYVSSMIAVVLPSVSHQEEEIQESAEACNENLVMLIRDTSNEFDLDAVINVVVESLSSSFVPSRMAALSWINMLVKKVGSRMSRHLDLLFPALLKTLTDDSEDVVTAALEVLSRLSESQSQFDRCLHQLMSLFSRDRQLLRRRGPLIVCKLCVHLGSDRIYTSLARNLADPSMQDLHFKSLFVKHLNLILLTSNELEGLRDRLKHCRVDQGGREFFLALYTSWCHNAIATLSLCLLAQAYDLAAELIVVLSEMRIDMDMLLQIDKLIQLLESPVFTTLRVHLLDHQRYPHLLKTLYGLLMLMPQSSAFSVLKNRLSCVPVTQLPPSIVGLTAKLSVELSACYV